MIIMGEILEMSKPKSKWKIPSIFFKDSRLVFKLDKLGREILQIAFPAALAVAADPIASLIDTAFIGHIGPVELAAVGVSIAIFNQASRITIFPLVSITTSFVAEEDTLAKAGFKLAKPENMGKYCLAEKKNSEVEEEDQIIPESDALEKVDTKIGAAKQGSDQDDKELEEKLTEMEKEKVGEEIDDKPNSGKLKNLDDDETKEYVQQNDTTTDQDLENGSPESMPENSTPEGKSGKVTSACKSPSVESTKTVLKTKKNEKRHIASASTALIFGAILGLLQAMFLIFGAKVLLGLMGVSHDSPMLAPARKYLTLRSIGAPAVLLSLAMQGIFRGFKDTKTPLFVIVLGYTINIILDPIFIFICGWGVRGAAMAHVVSQYLIVLVLLWRLIQKVDLLSPSLRDLQFGRFLRNGSLLLARVVAVTFCVTLAASMASRLGPVPMAAFQTCLQVWMTSSLLADGLAVAGQAMLACSFAENDYNKSTSIAIRALQMSLVLGVGLAVVVGIGMYFGNGIFSKDIHVQHLIQKGVPFVAATQPLNSLAFVFDGVNFGASDFAYSAYSLVLVAIASIVAILLLSKSNGFIGIWIALTIYMALRTFVGVWRMGSGTGPWSYLRRQFLA
uniref:Protein DETOXIFICATION n=1 Tax=Datisca glomerata TaxID=34297 RepID=A0A6M3RRW7_DATGL|nr:multidrug and toxic compound extrusion 1 [Datisca glomerata]